VTFGIPLYSSTKLSAYYYNVQLWDCTKGIVQQKKNYTKFCDKRMKLQHEQVINNQWFDGFYCLLFVFRSSSQWYFLSSVFTPHNDLPFFQSLLKE